MIIDVTNKNEDDKKNNMEELKKDILLGVIDRIGR